MGPEEAAQPDDDPRTEWRRPVHCRGLLREAGAAISPVTVTDLSTDGCSFRSAAPLETATIIWLKIDGIAGRQARVAWRAGDRYGCEFLAPIQGKLLDEVCGRQANGPR